MSNLNLYLFQGIFGAILFMLMYHFSLIKNSSLCALIPAIPIIGLYGLYMTYQNNNLEINNYLKKIITLVFFAVIFYIIIYLVHKYTNNLLLSVILASIIWLPITHLYINN